MVLNSRCKHLTIHCRSLQLRGGFKLTIFHGNKAFSSVTNIQRLLDAEDVSWPPADSSKGHSLPNILIPVSCNSKPQLLKLISCGTGLFVLYSVWTVKSTKSFNQCVSLLKGESHSSLHEADCITQSSTMGQWTPWAHIDTHTSGTMAGFLNLTLNSSLFMCQFLIKTQCEISQKSQFLQYYCVNQAKGFSRETLLESLKLTLFSTKSESIGVKEVSWVENRKT